MTQQLTTNADYARLGAQIELARIEAKRREILAEFPRLRPYKDPDARPRRKVSAAARRAMSEGMRKFWARRKAAK